MCRYEARIVREITFIGMGVTYNGFIMVYLLVWLSLIVNLYWTNMCMCGLGGYWKRTWFLRTEKECSVSSILSAPKVVLSAASNKSQPTNIDNLMLKTGKGVISNWRHIYDIIWACRMMVLPRSQICFYNKRV